MFKFDSFCFLCFTLLISCSKSTDSNNPNNNNTGNPNSDTATIRITSINPTHGPANTIDTISGQNFNKISVLDSVSINGKRVTLISKTAEKIIVQIPTRTGTGNIEIWYQGKLVQGPVFNYDSLLVVTTIAGSTEAASVNGQGINARFNNPQGIAVDLSGNIYVADSNAIRKISPSGNVTTLAGSLTGYGSYMDGVGTEARFCNTWGLAMGTDSFLYVGDHYNYRIRKVSLSGVVTTLAGISWWNNNSGPLGGQIDGNSTIATFNSPAGIAVDNQNNVYVADLNNHKIRKITAGGLVSSYAGGGYYNYGFMDGAAATSLFRTPHSVAIDPSGNLFVSEWENHRIRKITPNGIVSTMFGPLEPLLTGYTSLFLASALATDKYGNLFFAIPVGIIKVSPNGSIIRYATGGIGDMDGPVQIATFRSINDIVVDNNTGNLYLTDKYKIRKIEWQ